MVTLGKTYKDNITGFEGVAISRTTYLNGCVHVALQAPKCEEGKPVEPQWFDEQRVDPNSDVTTGGPGIHPPSPKRRP